MRLKSFVLGMVAGVLAATALAVGGRRVLNEQGIVVALEPRDISFSIEDAMRERIMAQLPVLVAEIRREIPLWVAAEMKGLLRGATLRISDVSIGIPAEALSGLDGQLQAVVREGVYRFVDGLDLDSLARGMARELQEEFDLTFADRR